MVVLVKYSNYSNVFSAKNQAEFLEYIIINDHLINLEKHKQSFFGPIYSLKLVKFKTLKTYIKINLVNVFI